MLYREIMAVCSEIHTKHINTLCGQNVELLKVKPGGKYSYLRAFEGEDIPVQVDSKRTVNVLFLIPENKCLWYRYELN